MQSVKITTNQAGQRLDRFLHKYLPLAGNGFLYKMLRKKNITLNGKKAEGREILAVGDEVSLFFSDETFSKFSGRPLSRFSSASVEASLSSEAAGTGPRNAGEETGPLPIGSTVALKEYRNAYDRLQGITVLYEDDNFLILNKPAGILTQKAQRQDASLNEWMIGYLLASDPAFAEELITFRPSVCNRLDRNTSGIVLCGKSLPGSQYLSRCIRERTVRKYYRTICTGHLRDSAKMQGYLVKDRHRNQVTVSGELSDLPLPGDEAAFIRTAYRPVAVSDAYTLLDIELITGKSHQIRAHLASIGHPVIGDTKYGEESVNLPLRKRYGLTHQLLHACRIAFPEEASGIGAALSGRTIQAPEPVLFERLRKGLQLS